jgi:membrane protein
VVLLWSFYSAQVFLLGAEFTNIYATRRGSRQGARKTLAPLALDNRGNRRLRGA